MIRIRHIDDPELKAKVIAKLLEWRGITVPEWFEMDDADYVDVLKAIEEDETPPTQEHDSRE